MRLIKARVQKYRSIKDTGLFDVESDKTILVGPNEAGKTVLLQALQQLNPPPEIKKFDALRDYPRSEYNDITTGKVNPVDITIVEGHFVLEPSDYEKLPTEYKKCTYVLGRKLDNGYWHSLIGAPEVKTYGSLKKDLQRLCSHIDKRYPDQSAEEGVGTEKPTIQLSAITSSWKDDTRLNSNNAKELKAWFDAIVSYIDEDNSTEERRFDKLYAFASIAEKNDEVLEILNQRLPLFVLFNNYFRVKPLIHLDHLATRIETGVLDDDQYDYGNQCLLKLLGFTSRELSNLGKTTEPQANDSALLQRYRDQLDNRSYQLNAASVKLTQEIRSVWFPNPERQEADRLRITADGQYLKVVVEDDLGVEIELDQRSEGFQWLVSFFTVFFAEAADEHENAILLLDEPGLSLHGLKQQDFRATISRLAKANQTLYTTHSPFLVGPDELDIVRVVEMTDRNIGTKVHTTVTAGDPAGMLPLQEALGYSLAQSLFTQQRNLVLEGLTDYWYVDATAPLLAEEKIVELNNKIALVPAGSAGKVVYYATILHAQKLKVAALLDSDSAGDQAAQQESLVHLLGNKRILRTKDVYTGDVTKPEVEDLLRETLIEIAKKELKWDVLKIAQKQPKRPIVDIFQSEIKDFSKYKLAKAYLRWTRESSAKDLTQEERDSWSKLIESINNALR